MMMYTSSELIKGQRYKGLQKMVLTFAEKDE